MGLPKPIPGLVIRYGFLWSSDADQHPREPAKYRPCVIVLAVTLAADGKTRVRVVPITHTPKDPEIGLAIPKKLARHLGLDEQDAWIALHETNEFIWPGADLRPIRKAKLGVWSYGVLPQDFFEALKQKFRDTLVKRIIMRS